MTENQAREMREICANCDIKDCRGLFKNVGCKLGNKFTMVYFAKTDPSAKIPTKRDEDAGYDIYACFKQDEMIIPPHTTVMIPTGIASACNSNYCFILKERGSTGSKGMGQRCGVIDSGFRNSWFVPITNTTNQQIIISKKVTETTKDDRTIWYPYSKAICQALLVPVPQAIVREIPYEELQKIESERGMGSLGSSNK